MLTFSNFFQFGVHIATAFISLSHFLLSHRHLGVKQWLSFVYVKSIHYEKN